jgi:hypothetical protein
MATHISRPALRERLSLAMDGVVFGLPPKDPTARWNHCHIGDTHVWRKAKEGAYSELAGGSSYANQFAASRTVPLWGGVSEGGFALVLAHPSRKLTSDEWATAVRQGRLVKAIKSLKPTRTRGPWQVLCDNEAYGCGEYRARVMNTSTEQRY